MKIATLPLTNSYFITVFQGNPTATYGISNDSGYVILNKKYIETQIRQQFKAHKMVGKFVNITNEEAVTIMASAGLKAPYIDYQNRERTTISALNSISTFLISNEWDLNENTWLIIPKQSKQLKGMKIMMEFNVGALDFSRREPLKMDLEVFMTPITKTSKSVKFSMMIPKFLYDQCMTDAEIEKRPKHDYIEADTIATLHAQMSGLIDQAHSIYTIEEEAKSAKKVICINFSSAERTTRDDLNHGYTGQQISTKFNFFVAYQTKEHSFMQSRHRLFTFKKYQTGSGTTEKGIKGIIDFEKQGGRNWIGDSPNVIIDWTQEREDFLTTLENNFRVLSENLNKFLADLDEIKLEALIQNKELLKLGQ